MGYDDDDGDGCFLSLTWFVKGASPSWAVCAAFTIFLFNLTTTNTYRSRVWPPRQRWRTFVGGATIERRGVFRDGCFVCCWKYVYMDMSVDHYLNLEKAVRALCSQMGRNWIHILSWNRVWKMFQVILEWSFISAVCCGVSKDEEMQLRRYSMIEWLVLCST